MVAKFLARSPEKRADPVVYLAGGPGDIAPLEVNGLIAADFIRYRDILVVSQDGTMYSELALTCASSDEFARELLGLRFYSEATKRAHLAATEAAPAPDPWEVCRLLVSREFIAHSTKMLHFPPRLSTSASSHHDLSLAAFITNIAKPDFRSTHRPGK